MGLTFRLTSWGSSSSPDEKMVASLTSDNWNDFGFRTLFRLHIRDENGNDHDLGGVKIGFVGQVESSSTSAELSSPFEEGLDDRFFALGQSPEYYKKISALSPTLKRDLLKGLNDVIFDQQLLEQNQAEPVFNVSLLRDISLASIKRQYKLILDGADPLTRYQFRYIQAHRKNTSGLTLDFEVDPEANPPSNVHVLIGRNGVGKTYLLNNIVKALIDSPNKQASSGVTIENTYPFTNPDDDLFSGVVSVSFSAFDPFEPYPEKRDKSEGLRYSYVGLKRSTNRGGKKGTAMSLDMLANEFADALEACRAYGKTKRLKLAVEELESDPLFKDNNILSLLNNREQKDFIDIAERLYVMSSPNKLSCNEEFLQEKKMISERSEMEHKPLKEATRYSLFLQDRNINNIISDIHDEELLRMAKSFIKIISNFNRQDYLTLYEENQIQRVLLDTEIEDRKYRSNRLFKKLSSGHAIVLLTITKLVEKVEEKTLVLIDEPEGHLHPPMLAAFIRSLSDLLTFRNGVAIIATHSPVVIQEVPKSCVWKLRRSGSEFAAERPKIETFGENLGELTRETFKLQATESGHYHLLAELVKKGGSYEQILASLDGQLGFEGRAVLRSLTFNDCQERKES